MTEPQPTIPASQWRAALASPGPALMASLRGIYGTAPLEPRIALLRSAVDGFLESFGDRPVRLVRAPGRLNLRGMHVDTHGGYLNLVTHQREIVVVAADSPDGVSRWRNSRAAHVPFELELNADEETTGDWAGYVQGALLRAAGAGKPPALDAFVASDLPEGASVSSSAALCLAVYLAACAARGHAPTPEELILATRDAEWHTGARTGTSDPAAMVLGAPGQVVHVSLLAEKFSITAAQRLPWPQGEAVLLTAHSRTQRRLAGADLIAYTTNRFAYSVAMEIFRQEMRGIGCAEIRIEMIDRLARIEPEFFGGMRQLAGILARVPQESSVESLRARYDLPDIDALAARYFGGGEPPEVIGVRGPLVFGIAESYRARLFRDRLAAGDYAGLGMLMRCGHDGDRVRDASGAPFDRAVTLAAIAHLSDESLLLEHLPGDYGASSPVLDALVDAAHEAGAYGACLTGAGIAGTVIALVSPEKEQAVRDAWTRLLASDEYARLAGWEEPLPASEAEASVEENHITAPAGVIPF